MILSGLPFSTLMSSPSVFLVIDALTIQSVTLCVIRAKSKGSKPSSVHQLMFIMRLYACMVPLKSIMSISEMTRSPTSSFVSRSGLSFSMASCDKMAAVNSTGRVALVSICATQLIFVRFLEQTSCMKFTTANDISSLFLACAMTPAMLDIFFAYFRSTTAMEPGMSGSSTKSLYSSLLSCSSPLESYFFSMSSALLPPKDSIEYISPTSCRSCRVTKPDFETSKMEKVS
mmetsp:Transcript_86406/g.157679  ORF Transcript_86406/g.157679 Transcript_86406/m.157679 type:complete len:230 (-) Transcript_86406:127-816(-)